MPNGSFFNDGRGTQEVKLNSHVVSGTISTKKKVYLSEPVFLTFQHVQVSKIQSWFSVHYLKEVCYGPAKKLNPTLLVQS